jgi:hypothetical protein
MSDSQKAFSARVAPMPRVLAPALRDLCKPQATHHHFVQFYERDFLVAQNIANLAAQTLESGSSSVLVSTQAHLEAIEQQFGALALDLNKYRTAGTCVFLDASQTLPRLLTDGSPDRVKFSQVIGNTIREATSRSRTGFAFVFGEMVALLCTAGKHAVALSLEKLWNSLADTHSFSLYCSYPLSSFETVPAVNFLLDICAEHSLAIPAETLF